MPLCLDEIVIWSRSFDEYINCMTLSENDLERKILAVADGASSFNVEARKRGHDVISLDPIYQFSSAQIKQQIIKSCDHIYPQILKNRDDYIWTYFESPPSLKQHRMAVMENFLSDFIKKKSKSRYVGGEIQNLPFREKSFDIAIVSHFLFLYSGQLNLDFHINSISNLLKIADEVRIFPLRGNLKGAPDYIRPVTYHFKKLGFLVEIKTVNYHFTKGSNQMLAIKEVTEKRLR
jgi:hypothetical protein